MAKPRLSEHPLFRVTVTAEAHVVEEFDDTCKRLGVNRSEVMRALMREWLDANRGSVLGQEELPVAV